MALRTFRTGIAFDGNSRWLPFSVSIGFIANRVLILSTSCGGPDRNGNVTGNFVMRGIAIGRAGLRTYRDELDFVTGKTTRTSHSLFAAA